MLRNFILSILVIFSFSQSFAQEGETVLTDEEAVIQTINDETKAFYERDLESFLNLWVHEDYISHSYMNIDSWSSFEKLVTNHIKNNPDPMENHEMNRENFKVKISGDMAWVTFDQESPASDGMASQQIRGERTLEREDGIWKLVHVNSFNKALSMDVAISGSELWDKSIAYHDPNGSWDKYSGKMNIVTARAGGKASNEVLEIRNAENFYQTTMNGVNGDKIIKRFDDGKYYAELNGNSDLSVEEKNNFGLNEENLEYMHQIHLSHFCMPIAFKKSGVEVKEEVMMVNKNGNQYLQLEFYSNKDKVVSSFFDFQQCYFYLDPITKAVKGIYMNNGTDKYEGWNNGELDVNGLIVPQVKVWMKNGDYMITDSFSNVIVPE